MARTQKPTVYSLADVMRLTGTKRPQIEYWVRKSIIRGEFEAGTGLPRQFVFRNLVETSIALELSELGVGTDVVGPMVDVVRYGDAESDIRTPWFVQMTGQKRNSPPAPPLTPEQRREQKRGLKAIQDYWKNTPLEDTCCADLNDDGTLKLLRLLRAYVESGATPETRMKGLLAVARDHLRDERKWHREYEALHRRWRVFKNPLTRRRNSHFWVVCHTSRPFEEGDHWRRTTTLTDDPRFEVNGRSVLTVAIRPILEDLEKATSDSWRATPENRVLKIYERSTTPNQLVAQALYQYEITDGGKQKNHASDADQPELSAPDDRDEQ
jgi:hypothetical protein